MAATDCKIDPDSPSSPTSLPDQISLDSTEAVQINLYGAQIVCDEDSNVADPPFIVSNRALGGFPVTLKPSATTLECFGGHGDPRQRLIPDSVVASVHQLQMFLRRASDVARPINDFVTEWKSVEHFQDKVHQLKLKLNKHQNSLSLMTAMFEDFHHKMARLVRAADSAEYVHNCVQQDVLKSGHSGAIACAGAFERQVEFMRKLCEDMKTEYLGFARNFQMMNCSVQEQLTRTFNNVHNSLVALYGRMETVRDLVQQLKVKHELVMSKRERF
ncbi:hypothetical protein M8J77_025842 [Diaphorina citri]|nr:hypothetical protein M8J77_025842 [Diaphorina citri]